MASVVACGGTVSSLGDEPRWFTRTEAVIYEQDDRVDLLELGNTSVLDQAVASVGSLVPKKHLIRGDDGWIPSGPVLGEAVALCEDEPFLSEPSIAVCTAVVVGDRLLATAGHCFTQFAPEELLFVQGYALTSGKLPALDDTMVSELEQILTLIDGDLEAAPSQDVGVARMAKAVGQPMALSVETNPNLTADLPLIVVGNSEGLPLKADPGARVYGAPAPEHFEMSSDTFRGGSGSPVFTHEGSWVGLLLGGAPDYSWDLARDCLARHVRTAPEEHGELAVRSNVLLHYVRTALDDATHKSATCAVSLAPRPSGRIATAWVCVCVQVVLAARRRNSRRS